MSKRKNRSASPNLPRETLERARRQIADPENADTAAAPAPTPEKPKRAEPVEEAPRRDPQRPVTGTRASSPTTAPASVSAGRISRRRAERAEADSKGVRGQAVEQLDMEMVRYRLRHPTRTVSEDALRQQYGYVAQDLRRIGLLAVGLVVALVVIAQVL